MKKIKNINLETVNDVLFGLFLVATIWGIYNSNRNAIIFVAFLVYAIGMFYYQFRKLMKTHRVNVIINFKRYLHEKGLKEDLEE
jgi:hypothetical protein